MRLTFSSPSASPASPSTGVRKRGRPASSKTDNSRTRQRTFMEASATAAGWLSFIATAVGLGSLITQASGIQERLDPYHTYRTAAHLGAWIKRQPKKALYHFQKPTPVGPVIYSKLTDGFCGANEIFVSRMPLEAPGAATWSALLAIYHEQEPSVRHLDPKKPQRSAGTWRTDKDDDEKMKVHDEEAATVVVPQKFLSWTDLEAMPLIRHDAKASISVTRNTLISTLIICNGRTMFRYSDASGHRAAYASYIGHFYINWPIGQPATMTYHPHTSHNLYTDVYPLTFPVRVDKCVEILCGVVKSRDQSFQVALPGRKAPGVWKLDYQKNGFPGAHGSRHMYNLMGGNSYQVDFMYARPITEGPASDDLVLTLPSTEKGQTTSMIVPKFEAGVLERILDCLPWTTLSWSIHRGFKDILVTYAKPTMDQYRKQLADRLRKVVEEQGHELVAQGWSKEFVQGHMAEMAASSVMAGSGNSGDAVRVVSDVALVLAKRLKNDPGLDEVDFWQRERHTLAADAHLSPNAIIGLTKCFVLEWSIDFDYQMYHDLPPTLLWY